MQRGTSVVFAALLAGAIATVVVQARRGPDSAPAGPADAGALADAGLDAKADGDAGEDAAEPDEVEGPLVPLDVLPDGGAVPELPASGAKRAAFGVILFRYRGAQNAAKDARPKEKALELAKAIIPEAQDDFGEAVKRGDVGSGANLGRVSRGILEPALEYLLFTLEKGDVYGTPIDTPTGYWVLRRVK